MYHLSRWVDLEGTKHGQIHLSLLYKSLSQDEAKKDAFMGVAVPKQGN
jgi:hypothetical protein